MLVVLFSAALLLTLLSAPTWAAAPGGKVRIAVAEDEARPPTRYRGDGVPVERGGTGVPEGTATTTPPTRWNPDGTEVGSEGGGGGSGGGAGAGSENGKRGRGRASRLRGSAREKYFHESTFDAHYDRRFATGVLDVEERRRRLRALVRTYLATMHDLQAETWIMHGSLLGWWWNGRIMPWDADIDVQVSAPSLAHLAAHYNNTVFPFHAASWLGAYDLPPSPSPNTTSTPSEDLAYLLDINPHSSTPSPKDTYNVIDARWIDTSSGLYIDITAVHPNTTSSSPDGAALLFCKDRHTYRADHIFPLRTTDFEGVPAKVPYAFQAVLEEEYGERALVSRVMDREGYIFEEGAAGGEWRVEQWGERKERMDREREEWRSGKKGGGKMLGVERGGGRLRGGRGVVAEEEERRGRRGWASVWGSLW